MQFNQYTASASTLGTPSQLKEMYIPLWVMSSTVISVGSGIASSGTVFANKGSYGSTSSGNNSVSSKLHTLNSSWSPNQKFAFEASLFAGGTNYAYVALWDLTAGSIVSASQISTSSTTATVIRSGTFTLTPGHTFGVTIWTNGNGCNLDKAHLVAFLS